LEFVWRCINQNQPRSNTMPVSGETKLPAGSMVAVSMVVTLPLLSICFTAGGALAVPSSVTQIVSPRKVIAVGKFKPVATAVIE
jgi:hypothetical protein